MAVHYYKYIMRDWINIIEGKGLRVADRTGMPFTVMSNPNREQMLALLGQDHNRELKGLFSAEAQKVYLWDSYHAEHLYALRLVHGVTEALDWISFVIRNGDITVNELPAPAHMIGNPLIRRMMGWRALVEFKNLDDIDDEE